MRTFATTCGSSSALSFVQTRRVWIHSDAHSKAKVDCRSDSMDDRVGGPRCFPWTGKMSGARFPRRRSFQEHETSDNAQYFIRAQNVTMVFACAVQRKKNRRRNQRSLQAHIYSLPFLLLQLLQIYIHTHKTHAIKANRNKSRNRSLRLRER